MLYYHQIDCNNIVYDTLLHLYSTYILTSHAKRAVIILYFYKALSCDTLILLLLSRRQRF